MRALLNIILDQLIYRRLDRETSLKPIVIGKGAKDILFIGGIHGNEVGTVRLMTLLAKYLEDKFKEFPNLRIHIWPVLNIYGYKKALENPDYFNHGRIGRFNENNTDLNRNFPVESFQTNSHWNRGKEYSEKVDVFCGSEPGSEPQNQALQKYIQKNKIKFWASYHSVYGEVVGANTKFSQEVAHQYAKTANFRFQNEKHWLEMEQTGTAKEWSQENRIEFIEIENTNRYSPDWKRQKQAILELLAKLNLIL